MMLFFSLGVIGVALGISVFRLGYSMGWKDCIRKHIRIVTSAEPGTVITIVDADTQMIRPGDKLWFN